MATIERDGGLEKYEDELWKMIAYASRYGHQPILIVLGEITSMRLERFNTAVHFWINAESKKGGGGFGNLADGGG